MKSHGQLIARTVTILITFILAFVAFRVQAQDCVDSVDSTTGVEHFRINNNGTVLDTRHSIEWIRCSVGQNWQAGKCIGTPQVIPWDKALSTAKSARLAEYSDWRLPSIHELSSITELRCQQPAINLILFPATFTGDYWTGTEFANNNDMAWLVHFGYGENHTAKKSTGAAVRLVRSAHR
jgi:hypothetical protein